METYSEILPGALYMGDRMAGSAVNGIHRHILLADGYASPTADVTAIIFEDDPYWNWRRDMRKFHELKSAAHDAAEDVSLGRAVLVTCHMGINRSGLVTGLILCALGYGPRQAILLIRKRRDDVCLDNCAFERCLMEAGSGMQVEAPR